MLLRTLTILLKFLCQMATWCRMSSLEKGKGDLRGTPQVELSHICILLKETWLFL